MKGILVVVPCGKGKIWDKYPDAGPTSAKDAYTGAPFRVNREYAECFGEKWVILSAKYGFVSPDFTIPGPYDVSFKDRSTPSVSVETLQKQIREQDLSHFDLVIGLGGKEYRNVIEQAFEPWGIRIMFPFAGLKTGYAMQATKKAIETRTLGQ